MRASFPGLWPGLTEPALQAVVTRSWVDAYGFRSTSAQPLHCRSPHGVFMAFAWPSILLLLPALARAQPVPPQTIDALVKDALKQWRVPGLALAIVHEDRLVYLK